MLRNILRQNFKHFNYVLQYVILNDTIHFPPLWEIGAFGFLIAALLYNNLRVVLLQGSTVVFKKSSSVLTSAQGVHVSLRDYSVSLFMLHILLVGPQNIRQRNRVQRIMLWFAFTVSAWICPEVKMKKLVVFCAECRWDPNHADRKSSSSWSLLDSLVWIRDVWY